MKLVICPSGHVTVVKWIAEGQAFDTSLRSVSLTVCPALEAGPCRLLGAPKPGKARLGERAAEEVPGSWRGFHSSRAPSPQPRAASRSEGWEASAS